MLTLAFFTSESRNLTAPNTHTLAWQSSRVVVHILQEKTRNWQLQFTNEKINRAFIWVFLYNYAIINFFPWQVVGSQLAT